MSVRLTNDLREIIANRAVKHAFDPKFKVLKDEEDKLAREAYRAIFPAAELAAIAKIPSNWVRHDNCLRFNVGGLRIALCVEGEGLAVPYRIGQYAGYGCHEIGSIQPGDLCDRIQKHAGAVEAEKAAMRSANSQLKAMLAKISTLKKLREIWPEGQQFYAQYEEAKVSLPAIRVDEINAALGLSA